MGIKSYSSYIGRLRFILRAGGTRLNCLLIALFNAVYRGRPEYKQSSHSAKSPYILI